MTKVFIIKNDCEIPPTIFKKLISNLSEEENLSINKKIRKIHRDIILLSRLLLKYVLINEYNLKTSEIELFTGEFGKPYLKKPQNLFFNISHSGNYAALAFSGSEVGVDIELRKQTNISSVVSFFCKAEQDYIESFNENEKLEAFYSIWTLKESYIKALGIGLQRGLDTFSVIPILDGTSDHVTDFKNQAEAEQFNLKTFESYDETFLSVCGDINERIESVTLKDSNSFIRKLIEKNIIIPSDSP